MNDNNYEDRELETLQEAYEEPKKSKKRVSILTTVVIALLVAIVTFQVTFIAVDNAYDKKYSQAISDAGYNSELFVRLSELVATYNSKYIGETDEQKTIEYVLDAYVASIDKYGQYLTDEEFEALMTDYNAELVGIGVHVIYNSDYNCIEIVNVMPDSPAMEAGVEPGDLVVYVGDKSVAELGYYPAIDLIKGEVGTYAEFTVYRGENYSEIVEFSVKRDKVTEQTVMHHVISFDETVGYVKLLSFDNGTYQQFVEAINALQKEGCTRFIIDVRYNPGGLLTSVVDVLDYLLPEGPIVRMVDKNGNEEVINSDAGHADLDFVVLCNGSTASAGELFTAAIMDYDAALVIGEVTYGKGTVQNIFALEQGGGLSISYKLYSPPYSDNFEGVGITPDIVLPLAEELANKSVFKITDEEDNQIGRAVEALNTGK